MVLDIKNAKQIYVKLLDEGTDVWRPIQAIDMGNNIFTILSTENYDLEDETWEFLPKSIVRCEMQNLSIGNVLVAIEKVG